MGGPKSPRGAKTAHTIMALSKDVGPAMEDREGHLVDAMQGTLATVGALRAQGRHHLDATALRSRQPSSRYRGLTWDAQVCWHERA